MGRLWNFSNPRASITGKMGQKKRTSNLLTGGRGGSGEEKEVEKSGKRPGKRKPDLSYKRQ
jgi:hypothetical protein